MQDLQDAFDNAKRERKEQATFIKDNANIEVEDYDPAQGPPELPEEEDPSAAGQGSTDPSQGQAAGDQGQGSGTEGAAAGGSGSD